MDVYGSDQRKIGHVVDIRHGNDGTVCLVVDATEALDGSGRQLLIPFSQVNTIAPDGTIVVQCPRFVTRGRSDRAPGV